MFSLARWGHRWHLASVAFLEHDPGNGPGRGTPTPDGPVGADLPTRNGAVVYIGPFCVGDWPSRDFDFIISILNARDTQRRHWLQDTDFIEVSSFRTRPGWEGRVLRSADR